jgi:WD40 repeat protein
MTAMRSFVRLLILVGFATVLPDCDAGAEEPPAVKKLATATDLYGDPLPAGAVARLGTIRFRSQFGVGDLSFSSDGKALACDNQVWDAATGEVLYKLPEFCLAISSDWTMTAHAELDSTKPPKKIVLREMRTGKKIREIDWPPAKSGYSCKLKFSPNAKSLLAMTSDYTALGEEPKLIDAETGKVQIVFKTRARGVFCSAFSPDGKTLALGMGSGPGNYSLQTWDIATGQMIQDIQNSNKDYVSSLAFSPNGKMVAAGGSDFVILADLASGKEIGRIKPDTPNTNFGRGRVFVFTPDSKTVIADMGGGKVHIWDVSTAKTRFTIEAGSAESAALTPDGKTLALGLEGYDVVRLWDLETGKELFTELVGHEHAIDRLAFSPDGKTLASGGSWNQTRFWNAATWKHRRVLESRNDNFAFSPDSKRLSSSNDNNEHKVQVWDVATGKETLSINIPDADYVWTLRFSEDGRTLFTVDHTADPWDRTRLTHWDALTGKQVDVWTLGQALVKQGPRAFLLAPDGHTVVVKGKDFGGFHDMKSGRELTLEGQEQALTGGFQQFAISADGRVLATGKRHDDLTIWLWEVATGKKIRLVQGHELSISSIAWSPDGRILASGDGHQFGGRKDKSVQTIRLWDTATGNELKRISGFDSDVYSLAFSPDGAFLLGGFGDTTILVWKVDDIGPELKPQKLDKKQLEACWANLTDDNAGRAYQACWVLIDAPQQSVPMLRDRLKPFALADSDKVRKLIADLDGDKFEVREAAAKELKKLGSHAGVEIEQALKGTLPEETRRKLESIANDLREAIEPETLRSLRAIMVLEKIATPEAREVLDALARGTAGVQETDDAKAALKRLAKRPSEKP